MLGIKNSFSNYLKILFLLLLTFGFCAEVFATTHSTAALTNYQFAIDRCDAKQTETLSGATTDPEKKQIKEKHEECVAKAERLVGAVTGDSESSEQKECKEAHKELAESNKNTSKACASAKVGANCRGLLAKCNACLRSNGQSSSRSSDFATFNCLSDATNQTEKVKDLLMGRGTPQEKFSKNGETQLVEYQRKFKSCPLLAKEDLEEAEEKLQEGRDRVSKIEGEIEDSEKKLVDLQQKLEQVKEDYETSTEKNKENFEEAVNTLKEKMTDLKKTYEAKIIELEGQLGEADSQIRRLPLTIQSVKDKYQDEVDKLDLVCLETAQRILDRHRTQQAAQVQKSLYRANGFNQLLSRAGVSSRKRGLRMLNKYAKECKASEVYKVKARNIKRKLDAKLKATASAKKSLEVLKNTIANNILKLKQKLPAESNDIFRKIKSITDKYTQAEEKALKRYQKQYALVMQEIAIEKKKLGTSSAVAGQPAVGKKAELAEAQSRRDSLLHMYSLKNKYANGSSVSGDKVSEALNSIPDLQAAAKNVIISCRCNSSSQTEDSLTYQPRGASGRVTATTSSAPEILSEQACASADQALKQISGNSSSSGDDIFDGDSDGVK